MNLAISNIAWTEKEDENVYELMNKYNFKGLEIAPTRFFSNNPYDTSAEDIIKIKKYISEKNIQIVALQSILFGRDDLKIFESYKSRANLEEYLKKSIIFASEIGAKILVFGSPKNRIMKDLKNDYHVAIDFFRNIGDYAKKYGVCICIEANPVEYGTNFINTTSEALQLVKDVNNDGFGLHIDIGTIFMNEENINILKESVQYIKHIHISEPYLNIIDKNKFEKHNKIAHILQELNYSNWISIEMKKKSEISNIDEIESTLNYISKIFIGGSNE